MKILYIITQGENGGGQKHVLDLATNFAKTFLKDANADQKYEYPEIYVATGKRESSKDNWLTNECEKQGIPKENLYEIKSLVREIHIKSEFAATVELWKLLNKVKPDIVHVHSAKAGILGSIVAKVWGAKVVYTVHGYTFLEPLSQAKKYFYIAAEFVAGLFRDHTILISKRDLAAGRKYFILKDVKVNDFEYTSNYGLVYNGLSESLKENLLTRDAARQYIFEKIGKEDAGQILLGNIANLYKTKGLEYAVMMMDKIVNEDKKNYLFVVFGEGEERGLLEGLVSTYNLQHNFFLLGRTANAYTYLSGLDFFVLSSVKEVLP
jgi:glycogen synthase